MKTSNKSTSRKRPSKTQAQESAPPSTIKAKTIKLRVDAHLGLFVVTRIIDGGTPQPPQRFKRGEFLLWCAKQLTLAEKVFTCYEAGPFGYTLHRQLEKMGITNYVVRPRDWDEYGQKVKTDKRDATALADCLDRYVNGNERAFCVVRVPTEAQEQERSLSRGMAEDKVKALVEQFVEPPQWGFLGQARVNVLLLNVALDQAQAGMKKAEPGAPVKS